jgi:hypothetical protein
VFVHGKVVGELDIDSHFAGFHFRTSGPCAALRQARGEENGNRRTVRFNE